MAEKHLMMTSIIHDLNSQDWSSPKPYFEGARISPSIQFWSFHLQGLRWVRNRFAEPPLKRVSVFISDLYNSLPPSIAVKILSGVFDESLGCLAIRYSQLSPSFQRLPQFRADIIAIALTAHDLLLSLLPSSLAKSNETEPDLR